MNRQIDTWLTCGSSWSPLTAIHTTMNEAYFYHPLKAKWWKGITASDELVKF